MLSIHTNYTSLLTQNNLNKTSGAMDNAMQRISTGFRINSAADDAAGLQIATRLQSQVNGLGVAQRNSQDAISMMQTAEGAFDEMTNIAHRMKDLATQAANGTNSADEHEAMQAEWDQLAAELDSVIENTQFGSGNNLFAAGGQFDGAVTFQIGSSTSETLTVDISGSLDDIRTAIGNLATADLSTAGDEDPAGDGSQPAIPSGAALAMDAVDALLNGTPESAAGADDATAGIGAVRSELGANINRLEHTVVNLGNMSENTEMAKGRIMDTDYAVESSNMMKNQMLTQMSMSMLSQANGMSGMVMSLVG
ncbi:Lateral flagellin [Photobacterium gaetbulicola]|uniref:Flagellin n=1 Tax=Photobacterium gaetbulicola TaxID=1295392 RepID=A0A0B9GVZ8_9GAMM|nr:lateral flagellin LafA [Photobacterium gaetbulicola]KHT62896.1 Lateral flagellin [Photobacterium gaetbulicola]